ncbi:MAG: hypothetical protein HY021_01005 [Burkholderiales bacterium]|nr:hypothetical protein [Burkholderiales bacterium]
MRLIFSVIALLVVLFVVLQVGKKQAQAVLPGAGSGAPAAASAPNAVQRFQQDLNKALDPATRPSEPSS